MLNCVTSVTAPGLADNAEAASRSTLGPCRGTRCLGRFKIKQLLPIAGPSIMTLSWAPAD
jgi:hypothetical protein